MTTFDIGIAHRQTPHLLADLVELLAVLGYAGKTTLHKNDILPLIQSTPSPQEEVDLELDCDEEDIADAQKNDRLEMYLEDLWTHLEYRKSNFSESYPFQVEGDNLILSSDWSDPKHRVYRHLLACSRLRSFKGGIRQRWAKAFTKVSARALKSLLPAHAEVRIFDANSEDRVGFYGTDCRQALRKLGIQISAHQVNTEAIDEQSSSGDAGLDLIGVVPFTDGASGSHLILGQCGAQETNWPSKTLEAHKIQLGPYFSIMPDATSAMFIPVAYRQANGKWVNSRPTAGILLIDRMRMISLLDSGGNIEGIVGEQWFCEFENELNQVAV